MSTFDRIPPPASPAAPGVSGSLPAGWVSHKDPVTGKTFFHNELTKVTQWDAPISVPSVVAPVMAVPPLPSAPAPPLPPTPPPASGIPPPPPSTTVPARPGSFRDPYSGVEMRSPGVPYVASSSYIMKGPPSDYLVPRPQSINRGPAINYSAPPPVPGTVRPPSVNRGVPPAGVRPGSWKDPNSNTIMLSPGVPHVPRQSYIMHGQSEYLTPRPTSLGAVNAQRPQSVQYRPPSMAVRPPGQPNYGVYTPPPPQPGDCPQCEGYECEIMDCVNCDINEGGQEDDIAPQRLPIIVVSAFLMVFSVVSFGVGGYAFAVAGTNNTGWYGVIANASGSWWSGLPCFIAGIIGVVALDKNFFMATAVLAACGAGVSLAGAVVDGLMAQTFWLQMDICSDRSYNFFGTGLGSTDALNRLNFCGNWLYSGTNANFPYGIGNGVGNICATIVLPAANAVGTANIPSFAACNGVSATAAATAAQTALGGATSCAGYSASNIATGSTNNCATSSWWTRVVSDRAMVCVRNGGFNPSNLASNTLSGTCYSPTITSGYSATDVGRLYNMLATSCAFSAINCATAVVLCILCSMAYGFISQNRKQEEFDPVGIEPKSLMAPLPPASPPALPPAPLPTPPPPVSSIDLKPLGQIK